MAEADDPTIDLSSPEAYRNRELSWLSFAGRVIAMVEDGELPLLERLRFAGISGMLHDEFFMKRISGLKRQIVKSSSKLAIDGRTPQQEFDACTEVLREQTARIAQVLREEILPAMETEGVPIRDHASLGKNDRKALRRYFERSVLPILTPLAVDSEHPFPFISNLGLNLAVTFTDGGREHFARIKVPANRPRWVPLPDGDGFVPLEQVIAANLDLIYPASSSLKVHLFRVTRGASGDVDSTADLPEEETDRPGSIILQVSHELKARRFAGVVRLQIESSMSKKTRKWLAKQLKVGAEEIYETDGLLGLSDLSQLKVRSREDLRYPSHLPSVHPRLVESTAPTVFDEIARGDILLHHPYDCFDTSVLRFLEEAAVDPDVLAIKLTIYRTSAESPIIRALIEACRLGKQVAVLVEVTARFDEAPNIAWGQRLEQEGAHVSYGVERLKTHVKAALVVREEGDRVKRYAHVGTGNYHTGTARIYEDLGLLTCDDQICDDVAAVFNALTGATPHVTYQRMLVAPATMRARFTEMIRREAEHAKEGRPCGIIAKMNQLQDPEIIRELYRASQAGVPIELNIRGLCCLRPGVPGLSETIQLFCCLGRFLEHSRIFKFVNADEPEYFIGSADWMRRNLSNRVETVVPVLDPQLQADLDRILEVYRTDNASVWDGGPDGGYTRRRPAEGQERRAAQEIFIRETEERLAAATPPAAKERGEEQTRERAIGGARPRRRTRGPRRIAPGVQP